MEQHAIERAIRRAHKRAEHEARAIALAQSPKARRRHERRFAMLTRAEREAIVTYQAFGYDLEGV